MYEIFFPPEKSHEDSWDTHPMKEAYEAGLKSALAEAAFDEDYNAESDIYAKTAKVDQCIEEAYAFGMSVYDLNRVYDAAREETEPQGGLLPVRQYARLDDAGVEIQVWPYPLAAFRKGIFVLKPNDQNTGS